jgi:hypothetical protein
LLRNDAGVLDATIAKRHVDLLGGEIRRLVVENQIDGDIGVGLAKLRQQRPHDLAPEAHIRADAKHAARRTVTQIEHVVHGVDDMRHALIAVLEETLALAGQMRGSRRAQK